MKRFPAILLLATASLSAQVAASPEQQPGIAMAPVHISVNFTKSSVAAAEFGSLSKEVSVAEVSACNETGSALSLSQSRMIQTLRARGFEVLSRNAAIAVLSAGQSQSKKYVTAKYSQIALNIISGLVLSKAVSLGPVLARTLPGVEGIMQVVVPQLQTVVSDHAYLTFDTAGLPSVLQLAPIECATGTVLLSNTPVNATRDFIVAIPTTLK